jgi:hypothetical protein
MRGAFMPSLIFWFFYFVHNLFSMASMIAAQFDQAKRTSNKMRSISKKIKAVSKAAG